MRKKLVGIVLIFTFIFILAACSSNKASSGDNGSEEISDELVIFNWTEYMPDEIIKEFEEEFDVKVTYTTFASNQEMLSKLRSGTVAYDLAIPSDYFVKVMAEEGLLEEINFDNVPNFKNISEEWRGLAHDPDDKYSVTYMYGYDGIMYNKDKVKETPTSWGDLWDEDYKGHVLLVEAADEINVMVQQYMGNDINDPSEEQITEGGELLKELVPNVMKYTEAPKADLVSGDAWIGFGYSGEAAVAYKDNPEIDFVLPEEGGIKWTDNMVIPQTTQNKATAEAFIDFMLRPEISKKLSEEFPYGNPNEEALALLDEADLNAPGLNLPEEMIEKAEWSAVLSPEKVQVVNRVFQEAKIRGGN